MPQTTDSSDQWVAKAKLRLAECEAEQRRLRKGSPRQLKLAERSERYQQMLIDFRQQPGSAGPRTTTGEAAIAALEAELMALKERVFRSCATLIRDRNHLKELKERWGKAADAHMTAVEKSGGKKRPLPKLDFGFTPPPQGASLFERAVHQLIRSLGL